MEGTFKGWSQGRSFGFIAPADGSADLFMHESALETPPPLKRGTRVRFEIKETERGLAAVQVCAIETSDRMRGSVTRWLDGRGFGFIRLEDDFSEAFAHCSQISGGKDYLCVGDLVEFSPVNGQKGKEASDIVVVGWQAPNDTVDRFVDPELRMARLADMGSGVWIDELADLAEKEPWDYSHTKSTYRLPVLRSYFFYTFRRLEEMPDGIRVSARGNAMSFNTGLVTPNQEDIFAFFRKNPVDGRQPWIFAGFRKASDREFVNSFGSGTPPLAFYFDDPRVLLYDRRCELFIDIDHVMENLERFPDQLQSNPFVARQLLMSAEAITKKRVYRNYKTAIPQYYRDRGGQGSMQLLLPICLQNPAHADLALVVAKTESGDAYRGSTVLTLDMAYNNARLLARPDTEWLQP